MAILSRVKQATEEFVKVLVYGKRDVRTPEQYLPHGIDSKPVKEALAMLLNTSGDSTGIVGYLIQSDKTKEGETRLYSTDNAGTEKIYIQLFDDGTIEIGGNADNAVRYAPLDSGLQDFKTDIQAELGKIQTAIAGVGGAYTPGTLSVDISGSKVDEVKIK